MKKLASILMALMLAVSSVPFPSFADDVIVGTEDVGVASGECGENLTWKLTADGTLIISGSGDMTDWYSSNDVAWRDYTSDIKKIVIGDQVTSIGLTAFFALNNLNEVTIPASVTKIGVPVFSGPNNLAKINVAEGNPNFTSVDGILFSKDKTRLLRYPNAKQGTYYKVPEGVTKVEGYALGYSSNLLMVDLPASLTRLGDDAFTYSSALTDINVASGNTSFSSVGGILFNRDNTTLLRCPEGKAQISSAIPQSVKRIESDAFRNCRALSSITLPNGLEYIGNSAFNGCRNLREVNIPYGITKISGTCFASCTSLKSIVIPNSVTTLDMWAFNGCSALESVTIPASVTEINSAFQRCDKVTIYGYAGSYAQTYAAENGIPFVILDGGSIPDTPENIIASGECGENLAWRIHDSSLIISGTGEMDDYSNHSAPWIEYLENFDRVVFEDGVTIVSDYAFFFMDNIKEVIISSTVQQVGESTFYGCYGINSFSVANNSNYFCSDENGVLYLADMSKIISYPLGNESTVYTVPATISALNQRAFEGAINLAWFEVADSNRYLEAKDGVLFDKTSTLLKYPSKRTGQSYDIPYGTKVIANFAFEGCKNLKNITIPDTVTVFEHMVFGGSGLVAIDIPDSVTEIGSQCFDGCLDLSSVKLSKDLKIIPSECFAHCESLKSIEIPNGVKCIDSYAFGRCKNLFTVKIPESVIEINNEVFSGCPDLTIHCYTNSYAQTYAAENGIPFVILDGGSIPDTPENIIASGECGENLTWKLTDDGILTISGTGNMYNWTNTTFPWASHSNSIKNVIIENGVTAVGDYAFYRCVNLENIDFNGDVTSIGAHSFQFCSALSDIVLPESVSKIGIAAFYGCSRLTSFIVPNGVTVLNNTVFFNCKELANITIPESVTVIGDNAFQGCVELAKITIPSSVASIGNNTFVNCPDLTIHGYTNSCARTYAAENNIPFIAIDGETDAHTARGTVSFPDDAYLADGGELIVDIWADGRDTGDYLKQRFVITELADIPFEFTFSEEESAVGIRVMITNLSNAETNLYSSSSSNLDFTLTSNGLDPDAYPRENYIDINRLAETPIVMPTGKMIYGKIIADDYNSVTTELATILFDGIHWTRAVINPETGKYFAIMPYNFGGGTFTPRIEKSAEGAVSNIIPGYYYYGDPTSTIAQTVTLNPDQNYSGLDFHVKTGYTLSGTVRLPDDAYLENYDLYCYFDINGERYYITGLMTYKSFGDGLREIPYMIAFSPEKASELSDFIPTLYVEGGMKDDMLGETSRSNVFTGTYYYSKDGTTLKESDADTVNVSANTPTVDIEIQTGSEITVSAKLADGMEKNYLWLELCAIDTDGNCISRTDARFTPDSDTMTETLIIPKSYIGEQIYVMYKLDEEYNPSSPIYNGKGYICADGSVSGFRTENALHTITSEPKNISFSLALDSEVEIPEAYINYAGESLESPHPYYSRSSCIAEYKYAGNDYIIGNYVTFSPKSWIYEYLTCTISLTDGLGNTVNYTPAEFNEKLSGERIFIPGADFSLLFTTQYSYSNQYGFAITDVEPVIGERPNTVLSVQDTTTLEFLSDVSVKITKDGESFERFVKTDTTGIINTSLENGIYNVSVYKEGFKPRSFILEKTDSDCQFTVYMNREDILSVSATVKEMTREDMREAGIDFDAYQNKNVYECTAVIRFSPTVEVNIDYICTDSEIIKGEPVKIENAVIYPVSKDIFLIVHSNVTWLKEMFDVQLLVANTSLAETVEDCAATLNLPEGLSLAVMTEETQSTTVSLGDIAPAGNADHHWYVCGDTEGVYYIEGTVTGTRSGGGISEQISIPFTTADPITVLGGSAMKLLIEAERNAVTGDPYRVQFTLENVSEKTLYDVALNILGGKFYEQYNVEDLAYSPDTVYGGTVVEDETHGYSLSVEEFLPGGKLSGIFEITFAQGLDTEDGIRYMVTDMFTLAGRGSSVTVPTEIRLVDEIIVHEWDGGVITSHPDCTNGGEMTFTCTACGETKTQPIPSEGHSMSEWIVSTPADCTQNGEKYRECSKCGYKETETIPAKGHIWDDGTPSTDGSHTTHTCPDCEQTKNVVYGGNIAVSNACGKVGETVTVDILIDGNPGISKIDLDVKYNKDALTLTDISAGEIFENIESDINQNSVSLISSDNTQNINADGTFATLTFNIKDNCEPGIYDIEICDAEIFDINGNEVSFTLINGTVEVEEVLYGDITGNGTIDSQDLLCLAKYFAGWDVEIDKAASDVARDGNVNLRDLLRLTKYLAGWDVTLGA